jgi:cytoskeletal protein RodZ
MKKKAQTPEQQQHEQLLPIGRLLSHARLEQGKSLEVMSQATLIRPALLQAIELAELSELPEPVYTRGLIRRYAEALQLDGETLSSQFFTKPNLSKNASWKDSPAAQLRPLHLYAAYVLLIVASVSGLSIIAKRTAPEAAAPPILDPAAVEQLMPRQTRNSAQPVVAAEAKPKVDPNTPIVLEVQFKEQSWVRVVTDGNTTFEGILQQGEERAWTAKQSLTLRAGNAGGVIVSYNQGESQALGKPGSVAERTFTPAETISMGLEPAQEAQ